MTTFADITRTLRRRLGDRPDTTRISDVGGINAAALTITVPSGHVALKFPRPGLLIDFDDGTTERVYVDSGDNDANTLSVIRAQDGTTAVAHAQNTPVMIEPRFSNAQMLDVMTEIVESELWPWVWVPKETTLAFEADGFYNPTVSDIEEVVYAYQYIASEIVSLAAFYLSPEEADTTNFPNGTVQVPRPADASTIYVAYRARPDLTTDGSGNYLNFPAEIRHLATVATLAQLMMEEETETVGPAASALDRQIQAGARQRAGRDLWARFLERRAAKMANLTEDERQRRDVVLT